MGDIGEFYHDLRDEKKEIRLNLVETFETHILPQLEAKYDVFKGKNSNYIIDSELGVIEYFPKSQRLLIRAENKWLSNGLNWLKINLKLK